METTKGAPPSPSIFKPAGKPGVPGLGSAPPPSPKGGASVVRGELEAAAARGDFAALEWMIASGAPFNPDNLQSGSEACAALIRAVGEMFAAAAGADAETCRELAGLVPAGARDGRGMTALHLASSAGSAECARALLDAGARIGALDADLRTALHWACEEGHAEVADLLLSRGADPGAMASGGLTAFDFADIGDCAGRMSLNREALLEEDRARRARVAAEWEADAPRRDAAEEERMGRVRAFVARQGAGAKRGGSA